MTSSPGWKLIAIHRINSAPQDYHNLATALTENYEPNTSIAVYTPETSDQGNDLNLKHRGNIC